MSKENFARSSRGEWRACLSNLIWVNCAFWSLLNPIDQFGSESLRPRCEKDWGMASIWQGQGRGCLGGVGCTMIMWLTIDRGRWEKRWRWEKTDARCHWSWIPDVLGRESLETGMAGMLRPVWNHCRAINRSLRRFVRTARSKSTSMALGDKTLSDGICWRSTRRRAVIFLLHLLQIDLVGFSFLWLEDYASSLFQEFAQRGSCVGVPVSLLMWWSIQMDTKII